MTAKEVRVSTYCKHESPCSVRLRCSRPDVQLFSFIHVLVVLDGRWEGGFRGSEGVPPVKHISLVSSGVWKYCRGSAWVDGRKNSILLKYSLRPPHARRLLPAASTDETRQRWALEKSEGAVSSSGTGHQMVQSERESAAPTVNNSVVGLPTAEADIYLLL